MTPRSEHENQRIRDERREQILKASAQVFARKGLTAAKASEIATAAGASHGLVYHYFKTKEEIFTALVERALSGAAWVVKGAAVQPGSAWDRLSWMVTQMLQGVHMQPELFLVMIQAVTSDAVPRAAREMAIHHSVISRDAVAQLIREAQASGEIFGGEPDHLATILLASVHGFSIISAAGPDLMKSIPGPDELLSVLRHPL